MMECHRHDDLIPKAAHWRQFAICTPHFADEAVPDFPVRPCPISSHDKGETYA